MVNEAGNDHDLAEDVNLLKIKPAEEYKPTEKVPVIDLQGLNLDPEQHDKVVRAIAEASSDWGFFQVVNHGIDVALLDKAQRVSREFFELSQEEKLKWAAKSYGFKEDGYGSKASTGGSAEYSREYMFLLSVPKRNTDNWPSHPEEYRETMARLSDGFLMLARKILGFLSEGVGLRTSYLEEALGGGTLSVLTNFYPPFPQPDKVHGFVPHSDFGGLTLLLQDIPGLLVLKENAWFIVDPIPGAITINISDLVELLSNGRYRSVIHRVRVHESKTRMSIASGYSCSYDFRVSPAPELIDEQHPQLYKPVLFGDYVAVVAKSGPTGKSYMLVNKEERALGENSP